MNVCQNLVVQKMEPKIENKRYIYIYIWVQELTNIYIYIYSVLPPHGHVYGLAWPGWPGWAGTRWQNELAWLALVLVGLGWDGRYEV